MSDLWEEFDSVIDEESWDWLDRNFPDIAEKVRKQVAKGVTPEDIAKRLVRRAGEHRGSFGKRLELAARHLERNK